MTEDEERENGPRELSEDELERVSGGGSTYFPPPDEAVPTDSLPRGSTPPRA